MDLAEQNIRHAYIRVTNKSDQPFTDRYDGIPVTIEAGKSDNLQLDMALHMFGYFPDCPSDVMFRHVCKRQGWNTPAHMKIGDDGLTLAQRLFSQIEIKPVIYRMVEETAPDIEQPIPADPDPQASEDMPVRRGPGRPRREVA